MLLARFAWMVLAGSLAVGAARAQAPQFLNPSARPSPAWLAAGLEVRSVHAEVDVLERVASTRLEIEIHNRSSMQREAQLLLPVPAACVVKHFDFLGKSAEPTTVVMPAAEARALYQSIVAQVRDPALLEFAHWNTLRSSVFPVPAQGVQKLVVEYEELLETRDGRVQYRLPRSEARLPSALPWSLAMHLRGTRPIANAHSTSHEISLERISSSEVRIHAAAGVLEVPGSIEVAWLPEGPESIATFYAYPDVVPGEGWFVMQAGLPLEPESGEARALARDLVVVLDSSGSMHHGKLDQAVAATRALLATLHERDHLQLIDFDDAARLMAPAPVAADAAGKSSAGAFLARLEVLGSTNIGEALSRALAQPAAPGALPLCIFMTDGQASTGERDPGALRRLAQEHNPHARRIFSVGIGHDLEAALLDHMADATRGASLFLEPEADIEEGLAELTRKLEGPRLHSLEIAAVDVHGAPAPQRVDGLHPLALPDLYAGDGLMLVGRYHGSAPIQFEIRGHSAQGPHTWRVGFDPARASTLNAFVPRLWASRRIDALIEHVRQSPASVGSPSLESVDPLERERLAEIHALSLRFGVLTEWTSFFAQEGTDLAQRESVLDQLQSAMRDKAQKVRVGRAAVAQAHNHRRGSKAQVQDRLNRIYDDQLQMVQSAQVVQVADRAFFKRGEVWVDGALLARGGKPTIDERIEFGSSRHRALVNDLQQQGRAGLLSLRGNVCFELDGVVLYVGRANPPQGG